MLFINTKHIKQILWVISFMKLQSDTLTATEQWKMMRNEMES